MKKPYPALCKDCKYSKPEERSELILRCHNPIVNAKDAWALSRTIINGINCQDVRGKPWPLACGMRGALWEPKE